MAHTEARDVKENPEVKDLNQPGTSCADIIYYVRVLYCIHVGSFPSLAPQASASSGFRGGLGTSLVYMHYLGASFTRLHFFRSPASRRPYRRRYVYSFDCLS